MNKHPLVITALIFTVIASACSSGSDTTSGSGVPLEEFNEENNITVPDTEPVTTDPVVTEPVTTEASVPDTEAETTTTVEEAPSTTAADPATPEAAVTAAIQFFEDQWKLCLNSLPECDKDLASERRVGEEIGNVQANALRWNQNGYLASNVDMLDYRVDEIAIGSDGTTATAVVCVTDPVALTEADGTVFDDAFYTSIVDWDLELIDGVWNSAARKTRGEATVGEENNQCA